MNLWCKYNQALERIKRIVSESVSLEELKRKVKCQYPGLEGIQCAHDTAEILKLLNETRYSYHYLLELSLLLDALDLDDATRELQLFKCQRDKLYDDVLAMDFAQSALQDYDNNYNIKVRC